MNVAFLQSLVAAAVLLPLTAAAVLALAGWFGARLGERAISAVVGVTYATTTFVAAAAAVLGFFDGRPPSRSATCTAKPATSGST
jgi:hypothetical protein